MTPDQEKQIEEIVRYIEDGIRGKNTSATLNALSIVLGNVIGQTCRGEQGAHILISQSQMQIIDCAGASYTARMERQNANHRQYRQSQH